MPRAAELRSNGERVTHLRDTDAVKIEVLVVSTGVLVVGADDVTPAAVPEGARDVVLQPVVRPEQVPGEPAAEVIL
jgi:hypothetical protein